MYECVHDYICIYICLYVCLYLLVCLFICVCNAFPLCEKWSSRKQGANHPRSCSAKRISCVKARLGEWQNSQLLRFRPKAINVVAQNEKPLSCNRLRSVSVNRYHSSDAHFTRKPQVQMTGCNGGLRGAKGERK